MPEAASDPKKVWVGGFPRPMLGRALEAHGRAALANLPCAPQDGATVKACSMQRSYSTAFRGPTYPNDFIEEARNPDIRRHEFFNPRPQRSRPIPWG